MNKHNKHNTKEKDEKRRKKALILWITLPLSLLLIGGGTVGVLAGTTNLFSPRESKVSLPSIFEHSTKWETDVSTTGFTGAGYVANDDAHGAHFVIEKDVFNILKADPLFDTAPQSNYKDVTNDIVVTLPVQTSQTNNSWWQITVAAKAKSRMYEGFFYFYIYIKDHEQGNLVTDFSTTTIDLSTNIAAESVDDSALFAAIKASNGNLNTNAIKLQYNSTPTTAATWVDWSWVSNSRFGTGTNASSNSLTCWSVADDCYKNIRIAPGGANPDFYAGTGPVEFTLKLYRPDLKSITAYQADRASWTGKFEVTPTANSYFTEFDTLYDQKGWYQGKLDGDYLDTWTFHVGTTAQGGIFNIKGNPYYNTYWVQTFPAETNYVFSWQLDAPVAVSTVIVKDGNIQITNLNGIWYQDPIKDDVIAALKNQISSAILPTISWNQIDITINATAKNITLKGITNSMMYSDTADVITYTLI